jgi:hypothetical protein
MLGANHMEMRVKFRTDLHCNVAGLAYDFDTRTGTLHIPSNECCNMTACIALFEQIDAGVEQINTVAGNKPDTIYQHKGGQWLASDNGGK